MINQLCFGRDKILDDVTLLCATCPFAAFHRDTLLHPRWFLNGKPKLSDGIWAEVLEVNDAKQHIFLQRILFMFQVTSRSAGKAQVLRVGLDRWNQECDLSCLAGYILDEMYRFKDPENLLVFPNETIALLLNRYIEG